MRSRSADDRISQQPDVLDLDLDQVAGAHEDFRGAAVAAAARRAGGDDVARQEAVELRVVLDELRDVEDQVVRIRRLHRLPVQPRRQAQMVRIGQAMQSANTDDLVFNVAQLIEYYSQF